MLDILFKNVNIYDGSGKAAFIGCVGVEGEKITLVCEGDCCLEAKQIIEGNGMDLAPGFIDAHSHGDFQLILNPSRSNQLKQGFTTEIGGQCGSSRAPMNPDITPQAYESMMATRSSLEGKKVFHTSFGEMLDEMEENGIGINHACFAGLTVLRASVVGTENRKATPEELEKMKELLAQAMEEGAMGFSTGLVYAPGCFADTEELIELAKVAARYGGIYTTHMRDEGDGLIESVKETLRIAKEANIQLNISHFKAQYDRNNHKIAEAYKLIDEARAEGMKISMDVYPYNASSAGIRSTLPPKYITHDIDWIVEHLTGPEMLEEFDKEISKPDAWRNNIKKIGFDNDLIAICPNTPECKGKFLSEIAAEKGITPLEAYAYVVRENRTKVTDIRFSINEDYIGGHYQRDNCVVGSDGLYTGLEAFSHPRAFGTAVRFLSRFIVEKQVLSREEGIRRLTGLTADIYSLNGKGYIREGADADLVLFEYDKLKDNADYTDCFKPNEGIHMVFVGGEAACIDNEIIDIRKGKTLRRNK